MFKRLNREITVLLNDLTSGISIDPPNDDITNLDAYVLGPVDTPYHNGVFKIKIQIPENYPFSPPKMHFITKVWHPNISSVTGAICLDILSKEWAPSLSLYACLLSVRSLLSSPEPNDPQDAIVARQYLNHNENFIKTAKLCTSEFCECMKEISSDDLASFQDLHKELQSNYNVNRTKALEALSYTNWDITVALTKLNLSSGRKQKSPTKRKASSTGSTPKKHK